MRILYVIIATGKNKEINKPLLTWVKNTTQRIVIAGDSVLKSMYPEHEVWECIEAGSEQDSYGYLSQKMLNFWQMATKDQDWDIIVKVDTDTILSTKRLEGFIETLHTDIAWYVGDILSCDNIKYCQGGCYLVSRNALLRALPYYKPIGFEEDLRLGIAMKSAGVQTSPTLIRGQIGEDWQNNLHIMLYGCYFVSHPCSSRKISEEHTIELYSKLRLDDEKSYVIVYYRVGWGDLGTNGNSGYGGNFTIQNKPVDKAISAHAPSTIIIKSSPGVEISFNGYFMDSAQSSAVANFGIFDINGQELTPTINATKQHPAIGLRVKIPSNGLCVLHCSSSSKSNEYIHTVWMEA